MQDYSAGVRCPSAHLGARLVWCISRTHVSKPGGSLHTACMQAYNTCLHIRSLLRLALAASPRRMAPHHTVLQQQQAQQARSQAASSASPSVQPLALAAFQYWSRD